MSGGDGMPVIERAAWNAAGRVAWYTGRALHRVGLWLCGMAGDFDGRADAR